MRTENTATLLPQSWLFIECISDTNPSLIYSLPGSERRVSYAGSIRLAQRVSSLFYSRTVSFFSSETNNWKHWRTLLFPKKNLLLLLLLLDPWAPLGTRGPCESVEDLPVRGKDSKELLVGGYLRNIRPVPGDDDSQILECSLRGRGHLAPEVAHAV